MMETETKKRVIYSVYKPNGTYYTSFNTRRKAKKFIEEKNSKIPSWHYDELWKMRTEIVYD